MAISTYAELQTAIETWAEDTTHTALLPDFIALAEKKIFRRLKGNDRLTVSTSTSTVAGTSTISKPTRYKGVKHISLAAGGGSITIPRLNLDQAKDWYSFYENGVPRGWVEHSDSFEFSPIPDAVYVVTIEYYQERESLSGSVATNDILTNFPDLYLQGSLMEFYDFLRDRDGKAMAAENLALAWDSVMKDITSRSAMGRPRVLLDRPTP